MPIHGRRASSTIVVGWTTQRGRRPHWLFRPLFCFQGAPGPGETEPVLRGSARTRPAHAAPATEVPGGDRFTYVSPSPKRGGPGFEAECQPSEFVPLRQTR